MGGTSDTRAYLYTGTIPASYTLGLIEAAMTGIPIVSIGPHYFGSPAMHLGYVDQLFEGHEFAWQWSENPAEAHRILDRLLNDREEREDASLWQRSEAMRHFSKDIVGKAWKEFLG